MAATAIGATPCAGVTLGYRPIMSLAAAAMAS